jgi:vitamin B12 transporter
MSLILNIIFFSLFLIAKCLSEIPVIVISPSKVAQNVKSIGSDVKIIHKDLISKKNNFFISDVLDENISGIHFSRQGGYGTNSIIQLRGLPKRYTNIYIDGVKQSDPTSPDNSFYLNNLTSSSIKSVEILKGNNSSVYGSGAIGGVISINSIDGTEEENKAIKINAGSNNLKNVILTYGDNNEKYNYSLSLEKFLTKGFSAMSDNDEKDSYTNNKFNSFFGYNLSEKYKIETTFSFNDTLLNYDEVTSGRLDNNNTDDENITLNVKIKKKNNNSIETLMIGDYYSNREVSNYNSSQVDFYKGERKILNYLKEYNFNLDKKLIIGIDNEFNRANFTTWAVQGNKISDEMINSQYFDFQYRHHQNFNTTLGIRNDHHNVAGNYQTARISNSYNLSNLIKLRSSLGTGIRFGSLNDYYYDTNLDKKEDLKPEKSYSFDFGIDKKFDNSNSDLGITFFYTEYDDNISNWASNTSKSSSSYVIYNSGGKIKSKGIDLSLFKKLNKKSNLSLNYTYTNAYDGEDCDDPNKLSTTCSVSNYPVRIPKHSFSSNFTTEINQFLETSVKIKHISKRRDYGNVNNGFSDVILKNYTKVDLSNSFKINGKKFFFNINNLFDKTFEEAFQYNTEKRSFNFGLIGVF